MGTIVKIVAVVLTISFFTFVALFGQLPALRKTPIGLLHRIICQHVPNQFRKADRHLTGGKLTTSLGRMADYLLYKNNPVILILFLTILTGSATLFLTATLSQLSQTQLLPIPALLSAPYIFTYLCAHNREIYITPANHAARLLDYPYDHVLFRPNQICRTCHLTKPARSKHCSLCGICVAKSDHHCPWIHNCLGKHNYRWFLLLLLSLGVLELYGAGLAWQLLAPQFAPRGQYAELAWSSGDYWSAVGSDVQRVVQVGGLSVAGVGLLAVMTAWLPLALLAYHVYLVWAGMTTNESQKWADWRDDMADGIVFRARRSDVVADERVRKSRSSAQGPGNGHVAVDAATEQALEEEPYVDWPVASDQVIVQTTDGKPPNGREHLYERIWTLAEVENIYDLGFSDNILYVLRGN